MFGTVVLDCFTHAERVELTTALDVIFPPSDPGGWGSACCYAFFDPLSSRPLYIGLAGDVAMRLRQHLGLVDVLPTTGTKKTQIDAHFQANAYLGVAVFPQSAIAQPAVQRNMHRSDGVGDKDAQLMEEALLRASKTRFGERPAWNGMWGKARGKHFENFGAALVEAAFVRRTSLYAARSTIRELAVLPSLLQLEVNLHAARMLTLPFGVEPDGMRFVSFPAEYKERQVRLPTLPPT